jgi:hypothetical protein
MRICLGLGASLEGSRRGFTSSETLVLERVYASTSPFSSSAMSKANAVVKSAVRLRLNIIRGWNY